MSTSKKKKVIVTTATPKKAQVSTRRSREAADLAKRQSELVFGKTHFLLMAGGIVLIALGMVLMTGGAMPDPDTWDESLIYSPRRIKLAPTIILLGIILEVVAIFYKPSVAKAADESDSTS